MKSPETYQEVCQRIADWICHGTSGRIDLTAEEVFNLDKDFPALAIHSFSTYMDEGIDAVTVLVSDEYCAKLICKKMGWESK